MITLNSFVVNFLPASVRLFTYFTLEHWLSYFKVSSIEYVANAFLSTLARFNQILYGPQKILKEKLKHDG